MSLLDLIPASYRAVAMAAAIAAVLGAAVAWQHHREKAAEAVGYARGHAEFTHLLAEDTAKSLASERQQREIEQRRAAAQKEIDDAGERTLAKARADALLAGTDAARLRQRIAALIAAGRGQASHDPAPPQVGPPTDDPTAVLADVLGRCVSRVQLLAAVADERGTAGATCERAYDSLNSEDTQH
jgi:hypothetical protein